MNCTHSFRTENKLNPRKKACETKGFFNTVMPSEGTKTLEFNQYQKPDKEPFIIYADIECLLIDDDECWTFLMDVK